MGKIKQAFHAAREKARIHLQSYIPESHEPFWKRGIAWFLMVSVVGLLIGLALFTFTVGVFSVGLPDVRNFDELAGVESTLIYDREGELLYAFHGEENRKYVPLDQISPYLQHATIAIEDDQFYEHIGFDLPGIAKGAFYEIFGVGRPRGGSTITQQLAKNAFLSLKRSYTRKVRELILSVRLERAYGKDKILELYLNRIPYGSNAYGAELASQVYFGKSAKDLALAEAAILAALPKAPTYYSPYGEYAYSKLETDFNPAVIERRNIQSAADLKDSEYSIGLVGREVKLSDTRTVYLPGRADVVLKSMEKLGMIAEEDGKAALQETHKLEFKKYRTNIRSPHFVFYVKKLLEEQYGKDIVEGGGLKVYTTIDAKLQDAAEKIVTDQIKVSKESLSVSNAALVSMDVKTGQILTMVGSADYFDDEAHGSVNHVFAKRQPGSSFKPIVYAKAFLNGYAPATVIYDTPTNFGAGYVPQNFEGQFRGPMSIRSALGQSRNIPAIKAYFLAGQQENIIPFAQSLGIQTLNPQGDYGPPLAIGAGEVKLMEMVQAFSVFARNGLKVTPVPILRVTDRNNKNLFGWDASQVREEEVLDPQVAYLINNILSDKSVYLGGRLDVPGHTTAAKTGTSNKEISPVKILPSNLWTIGYTPSLVTGVWAGNSDGSPTKLGADGYTVSAPIWSKFMSEALKDKPDEPFPQPPGIKRIVISKASGKLPGPATPEDQKISEVFASFNVPIEIDDMFVELEVNTRDNKLPTPFTPREYVEKKIFINHHDPISTFPLWLFGIKQWVEKKMADDLTYRGFPPTEQSAMFTEANAGKEPTIQIINPTAYAPLGLGQHSAEAAFEAPNGFEKAEFYLNDLLQYTTRKASNGKISGKIRVTQFIKDGEGLITVRVYDKIGYIGRASMEVKIQK